MNIGLEKRCRRSVYIALFCFVFFFFSIHVVSASTVINKPTNSLGMVGYWTFDGKSISSNIADSSGQGNDMRLVNFPATSTVVAMGMVGQALTFDGATDYARTNTTNNSLNIIGPITIEAWVKPNLVPTAFLAIVSKDSPGGESYWCGIDQSTHTAHFEVTNNGATQVQTNGTQALVPGRWYHITCQWNGANIKVYVNGVAEGTPTAFSTSIFSNTSSPLVIGNSLNFGSNFFPGVIDDVRVYSRALSVSEILTAYNANSAKYGIEKSLGTLGSIPNGLVGWWTFDGKNMVSNVADSSGQSNTGLLSGFTSTTTVQGKVGQALNFTKANNRVSLTTDSVGTGSATVCMWYFTQEAGFGEELMDNNKFRIQISTINRIEVTNDGGSGNQLSSSNSVIPDVWQHLCVTRTSSGTATIYINAIQSGGGSSAGTVTAGGNPLTIGNHPFVDNAWGGYIDDVRIYNRILSTSEITQLYNSSATKFDIPKSGGTLSSGLVGWWTFDGKDMNWGANKALDKSGLGNDGVLTNMSTTTSPAQGKIGQALNFDGVNDYIKTTSNITYNSSIVTVATWMNWATFANDDHVAIESSANYNSNNYTFLVLPNESTAGGFACSEHDDSGWRTEWAVRPSAGQWHHVVCMFDGSTNTGDIRIFIDGAEVSTTVNQNSKIHNANFSAQQLYMMARGGSSLIARGALDDVRVYNRALSTSEVQQLYNSGR